MSRVSGSLLYSSAAALLLLSLMVKAFPFTLILIVFTLFFAFTVTVQVKFFLPRVAFILAAPFFSAVILTALFAVRFIFIYFLPVVILKATFLLVPMSFKALLFPVDIVSFFAFSLRST